jgi:hypothetical protein
MAVFDERSELNKQKNRIAPSWDDSFGLKLLGYNQYGKNNAWGQFLNVIPGVNTGRHALAQGTASGDTKKVLKDTMGEAVAHDLAGVSLGINIAKTIGTGGLSGLGGGVGGKVAGAVGKGSGGGIMSGLFGGGEAAAADGSEMASKASDLMGKAGDVGTNEVDPELLSSIKEQIASNLINPNEPGTPEYDLFEKMKMEQEGGVKNKFKSMAGDFMKSAAAGNIFESAGNYIATTVADYKAADKSFREYAQGQNTSSVFNYL